MAIAMEKQQRVFPEQVIEGKPTLYSFQSCPFCFKVRALLGSRGIPFSEVEVEPLKKAQLEWSEWDAVPVFVDSNGKAMNESNDILHYIDGKHGNLWARAGEDAEQDRWMEFCNKVLGKSTVAVIYQLFRRSFGAMEYVSKVDNFTAKEKFVNKWMGALVMKFVGKSRAKMFDEPPRENMKTQLDLMSTGFNGDFFGGDSPNGADFANYGILRSMQGLNGFDIVESHETVWAWYNRLQMFSGV